MEGNLRFKIDWASIIAGYRFGGLIFGGAYFRYFVSWLLWLTTNFL